MLLEEDSGPTSAKTNLENILHKGESATHEMDAVLKNKEYPKVVDLHTRVDYIRIYL